MLTFEENIPLKPLSNFRIGGAARYFFESKTVEELLEALAEAKKRNLKIFILGTGTNILFPDEGLDKLVIKTEFSKLEANGNKITAGAGILMNALLDFAAKNNLSGLEWAGGLPGTLGGAIRGNAGCFKGEIKDSVGRVWSVNKETLKISSRDNTGCEFGYRSSIFKKAQGEEIILEATLFLHPGKEEPIRQSIKEKIEFRKKRHPLEYPNIGSIFKNIPVSSIPEKERNKYISVIKTDPVEIIPAGYLIEQAGLKGVASGGAMFSEKHANFIVNFNNASAADVKSLIALAKKEIKKKFLIELEEEVEIVRCDR